MPTTTPLYQLPAPADSDPDKVPQDLGALATRLDGLISGQGHGTLSQRPQQAPAGFLWWEDQTARVSRSDGSAPTSGWTLVNPVSGLGGQAGTAARPNAAAGEGTSTAAARADHAHLVPSAAPGLSQPGDSGGAGAAQTVALADHLHSREQWASATTALAYGQAGGPGATRRVADEGHTHGLPAVPAYTPAYLTSPFGSLTVFSTRGTGAAIFLRVRIPNGRAATGMLLFSSSGSVQYAVYADNGGGPGRAILAPQQAPNFTAPGGLGWQTVSFPSAVPAADVWLGLSFGGSLGVCDIVNNGNGFSNPTGPPPVSWFGQTSSSTTLTDPAPTIQAQPGVPAVGLILS